MSAMIAPASTLFMRVPPIPGPRRPPATAAYRKSGKSLTGRGTAERAAVTRTALASAGPRSIAGDHVVDIGSNARRLVAVVTRRLRDGKHLVGKADKRHRDLHVARHIEPEAHVLWHPGLARLELPAHQNLHDAPGRHRILLRVLDDGLEGGLVETALSEPRADLHKAQVLDSGQHRHGVLDQ